MTILKRKHILLLLIIIGSILLFGLCVAIFLFPQNLISPTNNIPGLQPDIADLKPYRNEEYDFEFKYPESWSFHENTFGGPFSKFNLIGASPEEKNRPDPISPSLLVNIVTPEFADRVSISLKNLNASISYVTVADIKGTKYEYEFENILQISIDLSLGEYRLLLGAKKQYEDVFNQILATFKFLR